MPTTAKPDNVTRIRTTSVPRVDPSADVVREAAKLAAVVEISGRLNASLYSVTQAELRRFKRLEALMARMSADHKMLESKIQMALESGAPIQAGKYEAIIQTTPARASTPWKELYTEVVGEAVVKAREAEAKIAALSKKGTPHLRVLLTEG